MVNATRTGRYIALCRKKRQLTQEQLASSLNVTAQAVSKWENGQALPDTALLPDLAKALRTTIDRMLTPGALFLISAIFTDGTVRHDVTEQLSSLLENDRLAVASVAAALEGALHPNRFQYLIIRYQFGDKEEWAWAAQNAGLLIDGASPQELPQSGCRVIDAVYGNAAAVNDATGRVTHQLVFGYSAYTIGHQTFDSPPGARGEERLTLLYANRDGVHVLSAPEGSLLVPTQDGFLCRARPESRSRFIPHIPPLGFGKGMDCSFAGAMTHALNALGHTTDYEDVMGASGACYRIHFLHPVWDYSSVDGLVVYSHDVPLFTTYGQEMILGNPQKEHRDAEQAHILRDLDSDKPVVCINPRVAHEWGLITGYTARPDGSVQFWCRSYFEDLSPEEAQALPPEEIYAPMENWPFILMHFGNPRSMPPRETVFRESLRTFIECMTNNELSRGYASGLRAYTVWSEALRDTAAFDALPDDVFTRRMGVNQFCMLALTDARRAAAVYIRRNADCVPNAAKNELLGLCDSFGQMHGMLSALFTRLPDPDCPRGLSLPPREAWPQALRDEQADTLDACRVLEERALAHVREILSMY